MKKLSYSPPEITVVDFKVEHCFKSVEMKLLGLSFSRETYYSTGEDYTEYTDNSGAFSTGDWI